MVFKTANTERLRIQSTGVVNIGDTTASALGDRLLQIGKTDRTATYVELRTATNGVGGVVWSDGTDNSNTGYRGTIEYAHGGSNSDSMFFKTAATEQLRINSDGTIRYGTSFGSDTDGKIITLNSATHLCKTFLISGNYTMSSTLTKSNANSHPGTLEVRADADGPAIICGQLGRSNTAGAYSGLNISLEYPKLGLYAASVGGSYGSADFVLCNNSAASSAMATLSDEKFRIYTNGKIRSAYTYLSLIHI